jgi:hypothetical protein
MKKMTTFSLVLFYICRSVCYATLSLSSNATNTISNEKGEFIFKIPTDHKEDSIYISHVSYKSVAIAIRSFDESYKRIQLQESFNQLPEAVIKPFSALDLVKQAIAKIPENYPSTPFLLDGFYRWRGTVDGKIINLSEAVFQVYSENYDIKNKELKLIKSRLERDEPAFNGNKIQFGVVSMALLAGDIVSKVNEGGMLNEEALALYDFRFDGMIDYNGKEAYEIGFDQKDVVKRSLMQGKLILDANSLAFLKFDTHLSPKGLPYLEISAEQQKNLDKEGAQITTLQDNNIIIYRKYRNKYYLNYIEQQKNLHISTIKNPIEFNPLLLKYQCLITRIDTARVKSFSKKDVLGNNSLIDPEPQ